MAKAILDDKPVVEDSISASVKAFQELQSRQAAPPEPKPAEPQPKPDATPRPEPKPKVEAKSKVLLPPKPKVADATPKLDATAGDEEAEITKSLSPKASENFKKISERAKSAESQLAQVRQEYETFKRNGDSELKRQLTEAQETIERLKFETHPRFKGYYDDGIGKALEKVKAIGGDEVAKLLEYPDMPGVDEAFEKATENLSAFKKNQLVVIASKIRDLHGERAEQLNNWKAGAEQLQKEETAARTRETEAALGQAYREIANLEIFQKGDEADWNADVDGRLAEIKRITETDLDLEDKARLAAQAVSAQKLYEIFRYQTELVNKLTQEIEALKGTNPSLGERGGPATVEGKENESYIDASLRQAKNSGFIR